VTAGEHLGEMLSAHLDGELTEEEVAYVEAHLESCADCRAELDATSSVRTAVREAPAVDPPFGFYERTLRTGARPAGGAHRWRAAAAVVGVAAAWIVVLGLISDPRGAREAPPVDDVRAALSTPAGPAAGSASGTELALPDQINGLKRGRAFKTKGGGTVVVFGDSPHSWIGVQTTPGKVDWSKLTGGLRSPVDGIPGEPWRTIAPGAMPAIVYESNGVGVTVAGPVDEATLEEVARQLPTPSDPSLRDRLVEGLRSVYDGWGPGPKMRSGVSHRGYPR
jgi:hypothetical protein